MATQVSNEFQATMEQGLKAQQAGNTELAYSFFAQATELDPNSGEAWYGRAGTAGDPDDALVSLGYATALQPDKAELAPQLDMYAEMRASVVSASDAPTLVMDGQKLAEVGLTRQAEFLFRKAKELDDKMEDASVWLAAVTNDPAEAERLLKKVLAQNPDNPLARAGLNSAALTPDLAHKVNGGEPEAVPTAKPSKPVSRVKAASDVDESDLPAWLTGAAEPTEAVETTATQPEPSVAETETEPVEDVSAERMRAVSESQTQAPTEPTTAETPSDDLTSQPWWNELSESPEETAPARGTTAEEDKGATWWGELDQPTKATTEDTEPATVPDELAAQEWWGKPEEAQPEETKAEETKAEEITQPAAETPTEAGEEWWETPAEETVAETPAAPVQDPAVLAADLLRQGQQALAADDKPAAYSFFVGVVELTPDNEQAWLGRARATDDPAERIECLEKVLQINPNNLPAREALTLSRVRKLRDEGRRVPGARERERISTPDETKPREPEEKPVETAPVAEEPVAAREEIKPVEPPPTPVLAEPVAEEPTTIAPEEELEPTPELALEPTPEPEPKPEPVPVATEEDLKRLEKFKSPSGQWNIPEAATAPQVVPVPPSEPAPAPGVNVTPYIWMTVTLIILILLVLAGLYILKI